jgi:hypothetical protein
MPVRSKKSKLPTAKDAKRDVQLHTLVMSAVPINTFAPEPYELRQPLLFVLQREGDAFIASFFDANVHASGDTQEEAFRNLKSLVLDVFDSLCAEPPGKLGPEPRRQLAVLQEFIGKKP